MLRFICIEVHFRYIAKHMKLFAEWYMAMYPYESGEPGDLSFGQGEMMLVVKKDGDWWTGVIGDRTGIFPSNYVQKSDVSIVTVLHVLNSITSITGSRRTTNLIAITVLFQLTSMVWCVFSLPYTSQTLHHYLLTQVLLNHLLNHLIFLKR